MTPNAVRKLGLASWFAMLAAFAFCGWLVGWLTGSSNSPVVGIAIPLIVGLLGALSYPLLDKLSQLDTVGKELGKIGLDSESTSKIERFIQANPTASTRGLWATGVILFCASCWGGVQYGMAIRNIPYKDTDTLLRQQGVDPESVSSPEYAMLYNLRLHLHRCRVPQQEAEQIILRTVIPILKKPNDEWLTAARAFRLKRDDLARTLLIQTNANDVIYGLNGSSKDAFQAPVFTEGTSGGF